MLSRLNKQLVLEKPVETYDGQGGFTVSWKPVGYIWGSVEYVSSHLDDGADFRRLKQKVRIIVRISSVGSQARPRPEQRFKEDTHIFDIIAVEMAQHMPGYLLCHCQSEEMT